MTGRDTPQEAHRFDVAISGASFAGLALACALSDALGPSFKIALIDRGPRTATVIAAEPCRLLVLDIGGFRTLVSKYPSVQGKIMKALAERLREAQPRAVV